MAALIRIAVPWALLGLFLFRARKSRIFLLGIPFLLFMGNSVFFDTMRVFHMPARLDQNLVVAAWMLIVWAVATGRVLPMSSPPARASASMSGHRRVLPEELAVLALGAIVLGHIVVDGIQTADFAGSFGRGLDMFCMILGYFLIRDVVGHASRREVVSFLGTVVVANAVATGLFVLHQGLHLIIYPGGEYLSTTFDGKLITRTFYFAPRFVVLTLAFVLARRRWGGRWVSVLLLTLMGVLVSYTRSLLLVVPVVLVLAMAARELKRPSMTRFLRRTLAVAAAAVLLLGGFAVFLPAEAGYLEQRLSGIGGTSAAQDPNVVVRMHELVSTLAIVKRHDSVFGLGFPAASEAQVAQIESWGSDIAWVPVIYALGLVGALALGIAFVGYAVRAFSLFMKSSGEGEYLGLMYLVAIVASLLLTVNSRSFMEPEALPVALWLFAFVAAEAKRPAPADESQKDQAVEEAE